jgi:hypothetical protein
VGSRNSDRLLTRLSRYYPGIPLNRLRKTMINSNSVSEIRTEHLMNATLERVAMPTCSDHARYERSCEIQGYHCVDTILRDVRPCSLVEVYRRFEETSYLHLNRSTVKMAVVCSSQASANFYHTARRQFLRRYYSSRMIFLFPL